MSDPVSPSSAAPHPYFRIEVVDAETKRGVPLIRLFAQSSCIEYFTDSNGLVAFYEPGLMGRTVYFLVDGHGYCFAKNELGQRAVELTPVEGGRVTIEVERLLAAQRIYRITGTGIYRDTVLLGEKAPIDEPVLNAGVVGQDSTQTAIYKGRIFWIWGDTTTTRAHSHWNFKVTGALSDLPDKGGLDPEAGVNLRYFAKGDFTKQMAPMEGHFLYWLGALHTVKDADGRERLLTFYAKVAGGDVVEKETVGPAKRREDDVANRPTGHGKFKVVAWGRAIFNDETETFESLEQHPIDPDSLGRFGAHPMEHETGGHNYLYFNRGIPCARVAHDMESLGDAGAAEVFTCLKEGCIKAHSAADIDRDEAGALRWGWKRATGGADAMEGERMVREGLIQENERLFRFTDVETGKQVHARGGMNYNPHRGRFVGVLLEVGGSSALGEVWYIEGDTPLGPFVFCQKIVTHNNYSFYNVLQHPYFAKRAGRDIFFEGTYTYTFSHPLNLHPTPRYDYNQIMYKLDLEDTRLRLPVPVYRYQDPKPRYRHHGAIPASVGRRERAFFAPDRLRAGTMPIHELIDRETGGVILTRTDYDLLTGEKLPVAFHAVAPGGGAPPPNTAPLYEYTSVDTGERYYSVRPPKDIARYHMAPEPLCLVWRSPIDFDPFMVEGAL
jgi:hypothetical protein